MAIVGKHITKRTSQVTLATNYRDDDSALTDNNYDLQNGHFSTPFWPNKTILFMEYTFE